MYVYILRWVFYVIFHVLKHLQILIFLSLKFIRKVFRETSDLGPTMPYLAKNPSAISNENQRARHSIPPSHHALLLSVCIF